MSMPNSPASDAAHPADNGATANTSGLVTNGRDGETPNDAAAASHDLHETAQPPVPVTLEHKPEMSLRDAIRLALQSEMARDPLVCILGADIGDRLGGVFGVTAGLQKSFGPWRVLDTPPTPTALVGAAVGMALMGLRPVVELQTMDYLPLALEQLANQAAKLHWRSGGTMSVPLVVRGPSGGGTHGGPWRSLSPEALLLHIPGLKVVMPSTPYDAFGLMVAAIRDNNPVVFLEPRYLYVRANEQISTDAFVTIGSAEIRRNGGDLTIITYGPPVYLALEAAEALAEAGIETEVIDLRTLVPLDLVTILTSVAQTQHVLIVHEDSVTGGLGAEIAATIAERLPDARIARVGAPDLPYPASPALEAAHLITAQGMLESARRLLRR